MATSHELAPLSPSTFPARLLTAFVLSGLLFMLVPGTCLGVLNLIQVTSRESVGLVSPAWIQAHGHAQIFGWIGSFILGIGFYSLAQAGTASSRTAIGWLCWGLWTGGVAMRWAANVYAWQWRVLVPLSAMLELTAFVIFVRSVSRHRPSNGEVTLELWIRLVISAVIGFGATLLMNLLTALTVASRGDSPALPHVIDQRFLILAAWGFLAPFVWGFSSKWLPVFVGLAPLRAEALVAAFAINVTGVVAGVCGFTTAATWCFMAASIVIVAGIRIFEPAIRAAKSRGVHASFPVFIRLAYGWLIAAAFLGVAATHWDVSGGIWGASRHAFTVGFVSTMVFSVGQRVLPAFTRHPTVWSPRLMFAGLALLTLGCALRVSSEVLAYQHYAVWAWSVLPVSAVIELVAVSAFALNLTVTLLGGASEPRPVSAGALKSSALIFALIASVALPRGASAQSANEQPGAPKPLEFGVQYRGRARSLISTSAAPRPLRISTQILPRASSGWRRVSSTGQYRNCARDPSCGVRVHHQARRPIAR